MNTDITITLPSGRVIERVARHTTRRASQDPWLQIALRSLMPEPAVYAGLASMLIHSQPGPDDQDRPFEEAVGQSFFEHAYALG